ncbi:MAG: benzoate transporter BenE [Reyranella sp.]|nr:MAG: benzoate transporter BenE [Reyranella sp.]
MSQTSRLDPSVREDADTSGARSHDDLAPTSRSPRRGGGLISVATAALVATIAGVGGTLPIVLAAAQAVGATPEQASSWVSGLGLATALSALALSVRYRMPIITAWSTPGAALIASTAGVPSFAAAVGAFVLAAILILLTAAIRPLGRLIERIPASIAAAMLAGILLRLVVAMVEHVPSSPLLVLPLIALFLIARAFLPALASLVVLVAGALLAWSLGLVKPMPGIGLSTLVVTAPAWDAATLVGLGVPLYLVTMASQNLPGFAVLRASGYQPPTQPILAVTGAVSLGTAFMGAHTSNLAAISAALCTGPDAHPDPAKRWMTGPFYALFWGLIALFGASLVGIFGALPPALLVTVAGTALLGSMAGAMGAALAGDQDRLAAAGTLAVTVSGVTLMGVGSAFWGLVFGLLILGIDRFLKR